MFFKITIFFRLSQSSLSKIPLITISTMKSPYHFIWRLRFLDSYAFIRQTAWNFWWFLAKSNLYSATLIKVHIRQWIEVKIIFIFFKIDSTFSHFLDEFTWMSGIGQRYPQSLFFGFLGIFHKVKFLVRCQITIRVIRKKLNIL